MRPFGPNHQAAKPPATSPGFSLMKSQTEPRAEPATEPTSFAASQTAEPAEAMPFHRAPTIPEIQPQAPLIAPQAADANLVT